MIKAILQGAVVILMFCFGAYGINYVLKKVGFMGAIQKALRPKPTKEIYDDVEQIFSKGKFNDFAENISKYDLKKQRQYIDAYLNIKEKKLKGGHKKHDEQRQSKKSIGKNKKAETKRTTTRRTTIKRNSSSRE